ncbi:MAG: hypothetical protein M3317_13555 [Actinomycetota bacterium]|nr:hypothetical protein [Actinomycetota bacterium]
MANQGWLGRRLADLGRGFVDTFLRDNRLLPPILALLALFVLAWVLAGALTGRTDEQKSVAHRAQLAQTSDAPGTDPAAPELQNPNVDSYAAYRSKDPFRRLLAASTTTQEGTAPAEQTTTGAGGTGGPSQATGANTGAKDSDSDGLPDRKETALGLDPNNPDTDGDGIPDGADDSNADGIPDGSAGGAAAGGTRAGQGGSSVGINTGGPTGRRGGLLNSGGTLPPP